MRKCYVEISNLGAPAGANLRPDGPEGQKGRPFVLAESALLQGISSPSNMGKCYCPRGENVIDVGQYGGCPYLAYWDFVGNKRI